MSAIDVTQGAATVHRRRGRDLVFALGVHTFALALYAAIDVVLFAESKWDPLGSNSGWSTVAVVVGAWLFLAGGLMWALSLFGVLIWWLQSRPELVRRTMALDSLLWLGLWLLLFLPWNRTRRIIIPSSAPATVR